LRDGKPGESAEQQSPFDETVCGEEDPACIHQTRNRQAASRNRPRLR
jgi:hypothetical protein